MPQFVWVIVESVHYNATLTVTGAIKGTAKEKLYNELGLEYLGDRRRIRRLCFVHNISSEIPL